MIYSDEYENKALFVSQLGKLLNEYDNRNGVQALRYSVTESGIEFVTIEFNSGYKNVDVTGDSVIAIIYDVYRALL